MQLNFFQTEPGSVASTKPVILTVKWSYSKSPLETLPRNLDATILLYFKYGKIYLKTSASNRTHKKTKKKEKNRNKRNTRNNMK